MLTRIPDFFDFFAIAGPGRIAIEKAADSFSKRSEGMMDKRDYLALGAIAAHFTPRKIFEIGTFKGVTSDFLLDLLPHSSLTSIAYVNQNPKGHLPRYNNSALSRELIGSEVRTNFKDRFNQIIGDSHQLSPETFIEAHGKFDLVLIDGDHSYEGLTQDTTLAFGILNDGGAICWHDANPKPKYKAVRRFLESTPDFCAIATPDDYVGGIAAYGPEVAERLKKLQ